jgi:hypothetical protein
MTPWNSQDLTSTDVSEAKEEVDLLIKINGKLTPEQAEYYRITEGLEISDDNIRH